MKWNLSTAHDTIQSHLYYLIGDCQIELSWTKKDNLITLNIYQDNEVMTLKYMSRTARPWSARNTFRIVEDLKRTFR